MAAGKVNVVDTEGKSFASEQQARKVFLVLAYRQMGRIRPHDYFRFDLVHSIEEASISGSVKSFPA